MLEGRKKEASKVKQAKQRSTLKAVTFLRKTCTCINSVCKY